MGRLKALLLCGHIRGSWAQFMWHMQCLKCQKHSLCIPPWPCTGVTTLYCYPSACQRSSLGSTRHSQFSNGPRAVTGNWHGISCATTYITPTSPHYTHADPTQKYHPNVHRTTGHCHEPRYWSATDRYRDTCYKGNKRRTRPFGSLQV